MSEQVSIEALILNEIRDRIEVLIENEDREYEEFLVNGNGTTPRMGIIDARSHVVTTEGVQPTDR